MFLHPWAVLLGILAAGLPVLIHWLTRPRPVRFPLSTLRFVREVVQQRRARHRLRDLLILAARTLAVLLLAAAVARPLIGRDEPEVADEATSVVRVVLLDVSQSMAAETGGVRAFERARPLASRHLEYRPGLKANLILAGARPRGVFTVPSTNFAALREGLAQAEPRPQQLDVQPALNAASEMLASAGGADVRRELIVVSDFQRSNWAAADFATLPEGAVIRLQSVAPEQVPPNMGILSVQAAERAETGREVTLNVEVGNFSQTPRTMRVEVALGETIHHVEGTCGPNSRTTLSTEIIPRRNGWLTGEARLVSVEGSSAVQDALPADNTRPCALRVHPPPQYALLTRQPASRRPSSSYFLERGVLPGEGRSGPSAERLTRIDPVNPDREALDAADLILLDHPGRLPEETLQRLASLVRRGRGLLYVAAEPADAVNLRQLTEAAGSDLQWPVAFAPPPAGQPRQDLFLTDVREDQPPFSVFGDELNSLLGPLRFSGGLTSRRVEGTLAENIVARYSDRSAFLVTASAGAGAVAVLNADLGRSNLPRSPVFVPLLGELTQHLLAREESVPEFASGETAAAYLPPEIKTTADLETAGPQREGGGDAELVQEASGVLWKTETAGPPGVYQVKQGERTVFAVLSTLPPGESDLRTLSPEVFRERLAGGRRVHYRSLEQAGGQERDTLWNWLAVACVACLLGEVVLLRGFRT